MTDGDTRRCPSCGQEKPLSEYRTRKGAHAARHNRLGRPYGSCRPCTSKRAAARRCATPYAYFHCLLEGNFVRKHRREALTPEFLVDLWHRQNGRCAITGLPMTQIHGRGIVQTNASIDRIDPSGGYEPNNVWLVCRAINVGKSNMTLEEYVAFCRAVVNAHGHLAPERPDS